MYMYMVTDPLLPSNRLWAIVHDVYASSSTEGRPLYSQNYCRGCSLWQESQARRKVSTDSLHAIVALSFHPKLYLLVRFTNQDEVNMGFVLRFSSTVLANTLAYQREMLLRKHNAALLEMARNLFSSVSEFTLMHTHYALSVHMPLNNIYIYIYMYI